MTMEKTDESGNPIQGLPAGQYQFSTTPKQPEGSGEFHDILKYVVIPGAIGGMGGVFMELRGIDLEKFKTREVQLDPSNNYWLPTLSEKTDIISLDFFLYVIVSLSLGAISGFIFTLFTIGVPGNKNRWRIVSSTMLFSLFFPSTTEFIYRFFVNQDTNNIEETYQLELSELEEENAELTAEVNDLISALTNASDVVDDEELTQNVIESYERLIKINDENPEARIEFIRGLGNLAVDNIERQPDRVERVQAILEDISQDDPDLAVQEEAAAQFQRISALN